MKRITIYLLIAAMMLSINYAPINALNKSVNVNIDGELLNFEVNPIIENNKTLVPIRKIAEKLGATVTWIQLTEEIIIKKNDTTIKLKINDKNAYVDNKLLILDTPPRIVNNHTLSPIRFIAESLGSYVDWDNENYTVIIKNNYYYNLYSSLSKNSNYKGNFNIKMVMDMNIENDSKTLFNFSINGLTDGLDSHIKGVTSIIKEDYNVQMPYEIISLDKKTYTKYMDEWSEGNLAENEQLLYISPKIVNTINSNFLSNFEILPIKQIDGINNLNTRGYLIDFDKNKFNPLTSNEYITQSNDLKDIIIDNYKAEIYINDSNEIIKETISYVIHGAKDNKKVDTLLIIDAEFDNVDKDIKILPPEIN